MSEASKAVKERPFPWLCPRCRRKEVRRTTISYRCERFINGQDVTVEVADLAIPKCGNCGELVFDYVAEEQIDQVVNELAANGKLTSHNVGKSMVNPSVVHRPVGK